MTNHTRLKTKPLVYPLISGKERLMVWERVRGMWKTRQPDPVRELKKIRKEWDRQLPSL